MVQDGFWHDDVVRLAEEGEPSDLLGSIGASVPTTRHPQALLTWAQDLGQSIPDPGAGGTRVRWEVLATVAARDLVAARVLEPHLDALAILREAGDVVDPAGATWGVWAAEGPGVRLEASQDDDGWVLDGVKPWCSLAGDVSAGLVTAWVDERRRGLFAVGTRDPGFSADASAWRPSGLAEVATATVTMRGVAARPVGGPGWYLARPGFAWGGIGVAAVWFGASVALARRLLLETTRRAPDDIALLHLGELDARLTAARVLLAHAAQLVDAGRAEGAAGAHLAARVRHVVADAAEEVLTRTAHGLGPGPLSQEPEHAWRVADLSLYLRQHHAERDAVALGRMVVPARSR
ncbi:MULTISPECIES: acyl-CoA dehydrogenase family protein [Janibacter]|uniref:acyl-CoA dehydrogenase family protein n=1 Tax=Janibacter TaxID=53457 RepID=UPI00082B4D1F|nr:acyl-CoA dehydrogenase family protein [Janibacter terrae]